MNKHPWTYFGDANRLAYGGTDSRCIGARRYQFIELINMDEACGLDNVGQPKYAVELRILDLNLVPEERLQSACDCCGVEREGASDATRAECCNSYGCAVAVESWRGGNARRLLKQALAAANALDFDAGLYKPVNQIGSTAREAMTGDFLSAVRRGCEAGDPSARIMAKMHGVSPEAIRDIRPDNFLPYLFGYTGAMEGAPRDTSPDIAPEYTRGYQRGVNVKAGLCPAPSWIQTNTPTQ